MIIQKNRTLSQLGKLIAEARSADGLTQEEVAQAIGVSRATINAIENGKANASIETVMAIMRTCHMDLVLNSRKERTIEDMEEEILGGFTN